jgi:uncharacterized protein YciI
MPGVPTRQQPLWDEHAAFMDGLFEAGRVVLGGPFADYSRALVVLEARGIHEVSSLLSEDPWHKEGILVAAEIIEWTIFLDCRRKHP